MLPFGSKKGPVCYKSIGPDMIILDGRGTLTGQLTRSLRDGVNGGAFGAGEQLPSSRRLASELGISRNVVVAAYDQLVAEGYCVSRAKSGTFVSPELGDKSAAQTKLNTVVTDRDFVSPLTASAQRIVEAGRRASRLAVEPSAAPINFEYGVACNDEQTAREWRRLHRSLLREHTMGYGQPTGEPKLRRAIARHLVKHRGLLVDPDQVIVTSGSQQALDLIARLVLEHDDTVFVEEPGYQGAVQAFVAAGARILPAKIDHQGVVVSRLKRTTAAAKLAYITPSHQFPTGVVMPVSRRLELLDWARHSGCYLIEDDYDSDFRYDCRPLESIAASANLNPVLYLGTFAKSLYPALRIGYLVLPKDLVEAFAAAKWLTDRGNPSLPQQVLAEFMLSGAYERHLRRCARRYAARRACLVESLQAKLGSEVSISGAQAGTHMSCWFTHLRPKQVPTLIDHCNREGVAVHPMANYHWHKQPQRAGILLGFAALSEAQIESGVDVIADAFDRIGSSSAA